MLPKPWAQLSMASSVVALVIIVLSATTATKSSQDHLVVACCVVILRMRTELESGVHRLEKMPLGISMKRLATTTV